MKTPPAKAGGFGFRQKAGSTGYLAECKMIVARSTPPIAEDIGFLPGTEEEKMAPWLAAYDDNLEVPFGSIE